MNPNNSLSCRHENGRGFMVLLKIEEVMDIVILTVMLLNLSCPQGEISALLYWKSEWLLKFHISQDARHAAEEEIYTNLNQKIDQFLQLADYDWMTGDLGNKASDYLVDLIAFLRSTFAVFTHLPVSDSFFYFVCHIQECFLKIKVLVRYLFLL